MRCLAPLVFALALLGAAGCGGGDPGSGSGRPADQFVSLGCAACHTLKAAGSHGSRGPNLDELKPSVAEVEQQVTSGGGGMPSYESRLSTGQIHALAVYVSGAAGG